jgi:hypothetical protein
MGRRVPNDEYLRRAPFPLYGLTLDWIGDRGVQGAGGSMGGIDELALRHGTGVWGEPDLIVTTLLGIEGLPDRAPAIAAIHLDADQPYEEWSADVLEPERIVARHRARWQPWTFPVDGRDQVFWLQEAGERWAAFARVGDVRVVVAATRWDLDGVRLAAVDPLAYASDAGSGSTTNR